MDKNRSFNPYKMFWKKAVANKTPWIKTVALTHIKCFGRRPVALKTPWIKTVAFTHKIVLVAKPAQTLQVNRA